MEYTDYLVARGRLGALRAALESTCSKAFIVDGQGRFFPFIAIRKKPKRTMSALSLYDDRKGWDWLLGVYDAEMAAWGFQLCVKGKVIATAEYGENSEWGIDRSGNGFSGDLDATARALGTSAARLAECLNDDGAEAFCELVGFEHQYPFYPHEQYMRDGVEVLSERLKTDAGKGRKSAARKKATKKKSPAKKATKKKKGPSRKSTKSTKK